MLSLKDLFWSNKPRTGPPPHQSYYWVWQGSLKFASDSHYNSNNWGTFLKNFGTYQSLKTIPRRYLFREPSVKKSAELTEWSSSWYPMKVGTGCDDCTRRYRKRVSLAPSFSKVLWPYPFRHVELKGLILVEQTQNEAPAAPILLLRVAVQSEVCLWQSL